ncbi:MAG: class I SAM-dependent methyltransferase [bacterium]|nr:class I SAM-dependent methyltransferase [bacterium]
MTGKQDQWARWLLERRHGGDSKRLQALMDFLLPVRDRVLDNAALTGSETVLDVGCGDGLIAFGALRRLTSGQVIFSDISQDLLAHAQALADQLGILDQTQFVQASATDLAPISDGSVDVVVLRSVLIYIAEKQNAFHSFYRVLKPGGRLSLFEPINRFGHPEPDHLLWGYDIVPVQAMAQRIKAIYQYVQPSDDPMFDFDERDLIDMAQNAGFQTIHAEVRLDVVQERGQTDWESFISVAPNPRVPTLAEAMREALSAEEINQFTQHLRPLVEVASAQSRRAVVYLWAIKDREKAS